MDRLTKFFKRLGPGLITGAADDDPAGIATYSLAGAQFGFGLLWTAIFSFPLMAAVQETCGRIGLVTRKGLAQVIRENYSRPVVLVLSLLLFAANTFNLGADLAGMSEAIKLLFPINNLIVSMLFAVIIALLTIRLPYSKIASVFKWLTLVLFTYLFSFVLTKPHMLEVLKATLVPQLSNIGNKNYLLMLLAIFGTTISPYLFFWQTSEEAEEEKLEHRSISRRGIVMEKQDTLVGMFFSNLIMYFIIGTCATTLFKSGVVNVDTAAQAAAALRPLAGDAAFLLFALGIIGTGILTIPILASSAGYAIAETLGISEGLNKKYTRAKGFYIVIAISIGLGFLLTLLTISPIKYLFYSAVFNGLISPVMILMLLLIGNSKKILGLYTNSLSVNILTIITLLIMSVGAVGIFIIH